MTDGRYCRQEIFNSLGKEGQAKLRSSCVVVAGCGGLGCLSSSLLVRAGVGRVRVVDRDYVEMENLQRQTLFTEEHARERIPKAVAAAQVLRGASSDVEIEAEAADLNPRTVEKLLGGFDLVVDGLDNMETRFLLNDFCVKTGVPWVYGAAVGATGMVMSIAPGGKPCLRCLMPELPPPGSFGTCDTVGVVGPAPTASASVQAAEAIKRLTGSGSCEKLLIFDLWGRTFEQVALRPNPDCPSCAKGEFDALSFSATRALRLCGRDTVEIVPNRKAKLDLKRLEETLSSLGKVKYNGYNLWFDAGETELVVFPDGRAFVKGTCDLTEAKSIYSKFVGL